MFDRVPLLVAYCCSLIALISGLFLASHDFLLVWHIHTIPLRLLRTSPSRYSLFNLSWLPARTRLWAATLWVCFIFRLKTTRYCLESRRFFTILTSMNPKAVFITKNHEVPKAVFFCNIHADICGQPKQFMFNNALLILLCTELWIIISKQKCMR